MARNVEIKALSPEDVTSYLAGAGMGYARAAEMNGYPGPMHILELADPLKLTADQRAAVQKLMQAHKADARAIGAKYVRSVQASASRSRSARAPGGISSSSSTG